MIRPQCRFKEILSRLTAACAAVYGDRLVSLVVFGSVGRGSARQESDVDLLVVADPLPQRRLRRMDEFEAVERALGGEAGGCPHRLSPVFKTPRELRAGTPLLLDMIDDGLVLYDRDCFFASIIDQLRSRLEHLGARRHWRGDAWFWDLKPDYGPGEVFEL
jgi:predicted nucleotidyltransferase